MAKAKDGKVSDLIPDDRNANKHSERGIELVDKSFKDLGAGRSVVVDKNNKLIAGNNSQRAATEAGITKTVVVETDGDTLVVVKRTDLDLDDPNDPRGRQMALIDNSSALLGISFDFEVAQEIGHDFGFDVGEWGIELQPDFEQTDYSGKNKEIDTDEFEDKMKISLEYTMEEFHTVKAALQKVAATPEQAVWQLLKLGE